ncbi:coproporphyrinogen III oxidase, anaerobic [Candidatus Electrothrix marina]|uniref:Heme chaperone HemW n=1 Tax=Candidatus Electrothrix marina TaxID=1859130 RepID=A0A444JFS3_9BACT|nr:coproporphyrinogen III oxidase, anaerobic [Candidatus Electrothrix marina]
MNTLGLYLHVPFCLRKCPYCSFYSLAGRTDLHDRYARAISTQLRFFAEEYRDQQRPLTSIFFGGGTPTLLAPETLSRLLAECLAQFPCADGAEISIEVNPATVDAAGLHVLRRAGFNRLSIGVQSLKDSELCQLDRPHTVADAVRTFQMARAAGFDNINLDLMYGLPWQDLHAWRNTLDHALELQPEHLSIYELTIEAGTPFAQQQEQGRFSLPDEDTVLLMLETTQQALKQAGLSRYEISNYAKPGCRCRHNINYWQNGEYIGLGAGAVAFLTGTRLTAIADADQFCERLENGQEVWTDKEQLDREAAFRETVITGLRMTAGVSLAELADRFGMKAEIYYSETLHRLIRQGMLHIVHDRLQLTARGFLLADAVMAELV